MVDEAPPPDWERYVALGIRHSHNHMLRLHSSGSAHTDRQRKAYSAGFAMGLAREIKARYGDMFAFDLMTGLADEMLEDRLPKGK